MDGQLYVWARRQEIDRELARVARVAEAREALEEAKVGAEHAHSPSGREDDGQPYEAHQGE